MKQRFWLWVMRFAYRRVVIVTQVPDGVPTIRSTEDPCPGYAPRPRSGREWRCDSDGHYLCQECSHLGPPECVDCGQDIDRKNNGRFDFEDGERCYLCAIVFASKQAKGEPFNAV